MDHTLILFALLAFASAAFSMAADVALGRSERLGPRARRAEVRDAVFLAVAAAACALVAAFLFAGEATP